MYKNTNIFLAAICLVLCLISCTLTDPLVGVSAEEVINIQASATEIKANCQDRITLSAELLEQSGPNQEITFTTEAGHFPLGGADAKSVKLTASGKFAEVELQSDNSTVGQVTVSATVTDPSTNANYVASTNVEFTPSFPDAIFIEPSSPTAAANGVDFVQVTTSLFKEEGKATVGTQITYEIIELDTATATVIPFDFANDDLKSIVNVKSANRKPGKVKLRVCVVCGSDDQLIDIEFVE